MTDRKRHLQGLVTIDQAIDGLKEKKTLQEVMFKEVKTVSPDDYVQDIIPFVLDSKYPLVVVNEDNQIAGIILRVHVLASLISDSVDDFDTSQ